MLIMEIEFLSLVQFKKFLLERGQYIVMTSTEKETSLKPYPHEPFSPIITFFAASIVKFLKSSINASPPVFSLTHEIRLLFSLPNSVLVSNNLHFSEKSP